MGCCVGRESNCSSSTSPPSRRRHSAHVGAHHDDDGTTRLEHLLATVDGAEGPPVHTISNVTSARPVGTVYSVARNPLSVESLHDDDAVELRSTSRTNADVAESQSTANRRHAPNVVAPLAATAATMIHNTTAVIGASAATPPYTMPAFNRNFALRTCAPPRYVVRRDQQQVAAPTMVTPLQTLNGRDLGDEDQGAEACQQPPPPLPFALSAAPQEALVPAPLCVETVTGTVALPLVYSSCGGDDEQSLVVDHCDDHEEHAPCNVGEGMFNAAGSDGSIASESSRSTLPVAHHQGAVATDGERDVLHDQQVRRGSSSSLPSPRSLSWNPLQSEEREPECEAEVASVLDSALYAPHRTHERSCSSRPSSLSTRDDPPLEPSLWTSAHSSGSIFLCDHNATDTNGWGDGQLFSPFEVEATALRQLDRRSSEGEVSKSILNDDDPPCCAVLNGSSTFQKSSQTSFAASAKSGTASAHLEDVGMTAQRVRTPIPPLRCGDPGTVTQTGPVDSVLSGEEGGSMSVSVAPDPSLAPTAAAYDETWTRSCAGASLLSWSREELLEVAI